MIRITKNSLIIEIPVNHNEPLAYLHDLQTALINVPVIVDYKEAPQNELAWSLNKIANFLMEISPSREQLSLVNDLLNNEPKIFQSFNKL